MRRPRLCRSVAAAVFGVFLSASAVLAQSALGTPGLGAGALADSVSQARAPRSVLAGPVDPVHYRIGPGDVLSLEYTGRATGSRPITVDSEGRARIPNLGIVNVGGRTLADVRADVIEGMKKFLPGATIDLRLVQPRSFRVFVLGEVRAPGTVEALGSARALEAIEAAGGFGAEGSRRNVRVVRRSGREETADLERFLRTGEWSSNPYLEDGDRIIVGLVRERISVVGAVGRPGRLEYRRGDELETAFQLAGDPLPEAELDSVLVVRFRGARDTDSLWVNATTAEARAAFPLEADDRVFVGRQAEWRHSHSVSISGDVMHPGVYPIREGADRVSDLVRWTGGFTGHAATEGVRLYRRPASKEEDLEFERLSRLSRAEMTNAEYQTFRSKLAVRQSAYLIDFSSGLPMPPEFDVLLRDGDHVDVAREERSVRVDGQVQRPGFVAYREGWKVQDYLRLAGGPSRQADVGNARLTRAGASTTQFAHDVDRILPGDFIFVPEKKDVAFWDVFRDVIIVAGQAATIVLLIDSLNE